MLFSTETFGQLNKNNYVVIILCQCYQPWTSKNKGTAETDWKVEEGENPIREMQNKQCPHFMKYIHKKYFQCLIE